MRIIYLFIISAFLFSCTDDKVEKGDTEFENFESIVTEEPAALDIKRNVLLTIKATPNTTINIEQSIRGTILSDSVFTNEDGLFVGEFQLDRLGFYRTSSTGLPSALLIIDSDSIFVDMTVTNTDFALIGNSEESKQFLIYQKIASKYAVLFNEVRTNGGDEASVYQNRRNEIKSYIKSAAPSFSALNAINEFYNENELPFLIDVVGLFETSPEAMLYAKRFVDGVRKMEADVKSSPTKLGTQVLNFELKDINGITGDLAKTKGKIILIDFWASWCGPCRKENPNVKRVYSKYKDKGLEILSISLDTDKDAWKKAIEQDQMNWSHMIDERDPSKSIAARYNVTGIPFTLLLDENYKIIAKNIRGAELELKIAELLGE